MRYLVLLRGSAGSGKSTWLQNNNLDQYAINADVVRLMFQSPVMDIYGKVNISQKNDGKVWQFIRQLTEERMKRGELTIIDATHSRTSLIQDYKKLCEQYRYRCVVVEFENDVEKVLAQNASRPEVKRVPEEAIRNMCERIATQPTPNWCTKTTPDKFLEEYGEVKIFDFNKYEKIIHFGDIHGCVEPLKEYFDANPYNEGYYYVFTGDYIDRGIQNKETLEFLFELMEKPNVLFLEGNHERWLRAYSEDKLDDIRSNEFKKYTIPQIESLDKKQIREFCRRLGQLALYEFGDNIFFVCHGGYPAIPTPFTASDELILGTGKYEDYLTMEETWNKNNKSNQFLIHGHRNTEETPTVFGNTYNLCDKIEFGKNLRVLTFSKDGDNVIQEILLIKNNTFFVNEFSTREKIVIDENNILESMMNNKLISVKRLDNNIVSLNFTRDAFFDKEWNDLTVRARGLFVNTVTKEIVARSYEKFFNFEENDSMKLNELRRNMVFPAKAFLKYGGYLGIVGYNSEKDELFIATKSTNKGEMQKQFKELLSKRVSLNDIKEFCKNFNQSLLFEVLDPINDPHIIKYDRQEVVLLDCIDRNWNFNRVYDLNDVAKQFGLVAKEETHVFNSYDEFYKFTEDVDKEGFRFKDVFVEGFVVEDSNGFMVKFKTKYYKFWKFMRSIKEKIGTGHEVNTAWFTTAKQNSVYAFMRNKGRDYCKEKSIIQVRDDYETS
jgi:predicted kinase